MGWVGCEKREVGDGGPRFTGSGNMQLDAQDPRWEY